MVSKTQMQRGRALRIAVGITMLVIIVVGVAAGTNVNSCRTISSPGNYVLTTNINGYLFSPCISITSSNVTFDGAGYTINGTTYVFGSHGFSVYNSSITLTNVTVKNLKVTNRDYGIFIQNVQKGRFVNNTVRWNNYGITIGSSSNNILSNNIVSNGLYGFYLSGSSNNNLTGNNVSSMGQGILFLSSSNNNLTSNNVSSNVYYGIILSSSNNNSLTSNTVSNNTRWDFYSVGNSINNTVTNLSINPTISFTGKDISIKSASSPAPDPDGYKNISKFINATNNSADSWLFLNISYTDSDVAGLNENSLNIWRYNGSWSKVAGINDVNTIRKYVYANITSFGIFAPLGDEPPHLTSINVTPNPKTLVVGDIQTFTALSKDQYDAEFTAIVTWTSSNTTVGTIDAETGNFTALVAGTTMVNATNGSVTGTAIVSVIPTYNISGYVFDNFFVGEEGVLVQNGSNTTITATSGYYSITGLLNGTYNVSYSKAGFSIGYLEITISGTDVLNANKTIFDNMPPASVKDLVNLSYSENYINWTWTDPTDLDFAMVMVYLNGIYKDNVTNGTQYYNVTVAPGTYTIGTRTVDTSGNINATLVTHTATTILPPIRYINGTVIDSINKTSITGAKVIANSTLSTLTNSDGFYSFAVTDGAFNLTATFDITYYTNITTVSTIGKAVVMQDIEMIKKPTGNITGSVTS